MWLVFGDQNKSDFSQLSFGCWVATSEYQWTRTPQSELADLNTTQGTQGCLLSTIQTPTALSRCWDKYSLLHGNLVILVNFDNLGLCTESGSNGLWSWHFCFIWVFYSKYTLIVFLPSPLAPTKEFCHSMEDLNSNSAFKNPCIGKGTSGRHFATSTISTTATPSCHLKVPGSLIPRSKSSSHLPQNPYGEMHITRPSPSSSPKSFSQWDVASTTRKHTDRNSQVTCTHTQTHTHIHVLRNQYSIAIFFPHQYSTLVMFLSDRLTAIV